ncbi:MAG: CNP1-like family protein [Neisseria sp.]|nr:CNP1-like family protein [Neisseria sp.]
MKRFALTLLAFAMTSAYAVHYDRDKDDELNHRYVESEQKNFEESQQELPAVPNAQTGDWQAIYVSPTYDKKPAILLNSVYLAPDNSVRYVLNIRSARGSDNISAEAIYCATSSFGADKKSAYKIFAYADTINQRWIQVRNAKWHDFGAILSNKDPVRHVLYQTWCTDGLPNSQAGLLQRLAERAGREPASGKHEILGK